jgi:signal transduction histidine kinase/DNA-binding response OmpR family regulator
LATDGKTVAPEDCLAGGGEMGALMRALDWSTTPLGPVSSWPQSLRTTVSTCLSSRFPILIWWGPELVMLYNDAYRPILGATKHPAAMGQPGRDCWPDVWHIIGPMLEGVLARGDATWSEDQMLPLHRSGYVEECFFTFSYSPIRDESGGVGGVFTCVTETTERVVGERRLETLRRLGDASVGARSPREACLHAANVLGTNPADIPWSVIALTPDGQAPALAATSGLALSAVDLRRLPAIQLALTTGQVQLVEDAHQLPRSGPWPEPVKDVAVVPIPSPVPGVAEGVLVIGISPRRAFDDAYERFLRLVAGHFGTAVANARAYEKERERAEALAQLDLAKTKFFSNVSHELRTPLTLMLGPLADQLEDGALEPALRDRLELVQRNAQRMLKLVNTMLNFSRIEAGRVEASYERVDLATFTAELASAFRSATDQAGLELVVDCAPLAVPAWVDRDMWEKIVLNLLSNAFKFTFAGRIAVRLDAPDGDRLRLRVEDTGVGIPADEQAKVFDRFHRAEHTRGRSYEGSGIGLALVQELVKLHGGAITVDSEVGRGTAFTVTIPAGHAHLPEHQLKGTPAGESTRPLSPTELPALRAYLDEALGWLPEAAAATLPARAAAAGDEPPARILVVDDNGDMRAYLRRLLSERWTVVTVADALAALRAAREGRHDLIITDVMLPGMDGFELVHELKGDPRTASTPVILLSARAAEEARIEGLASGADEYMVKPFSARELLARVAHQLELARVRRALDDQRAGLYQLFLHAPEPICVVRGADLIVEMANVAYIETFGRGDIVGKKLLEVFPELAGQGYDMLLLEAMRQRRPVFRREAYARVSHTAGTMHESWWSFVYAPLPAGEDVDDDRVMIYCHDVTYAHRARQELDEARHQAEEANRAKDEFLAMLGHELRNPLAPILTALQLMRLKGAEGTVRERTIIERQVRHLVSLVDDLLDVSRITRGKVLLHKERVEIGDVIAKAIEMASPLLEQQQHALTLEVPRHGVAVDGDAPRLAQVISNLLANAAKYTPPAGLIKVQAGLEEDQVVVSVRDTGIGIDPEVLPHIFDPFTQAPQAMDRARGGLGLGLAIVRSLVSLHGGTVEARSEGRGRGAELVVKLPVARGAPAPAATPARHDEPLRMGLRVLVVDDNEDAARVLAETLEHLGCLVRYAIDPLSALDIAVELDPDVALLDIGLPVMDGFELAGHFQAHPRLRRTRLIAVTGYGQDRDRARSAAAGFEAHLVKPIDVDILRSALDRRLESAAS